MYAKHIANTSAQAYEYMLTDGLFTVGAVMCVLMQAIKYCCYGEQEFRYDINKETVLK